MARWIAGSFQQREEEMAESDTYGANIATLTTGQSRTFDARNAVAVVVRAGAGATASCSAVDSLAASDHTSGAENAVDVAANTFENLFELLGPHPFYRVSSAGGSTRVTVVL